MNGQEAPPQRMATEPHQQLQQMAAGTHDRHRQTANRTIDDSQAWHHPSTPLSSL